MLTVKPGDLENLDYAYIGRPIFSGDSYNKYTKYADFRIYAGAISDSQIVGLNIAETLAALNGN
jgi:hypothetical protein